MTIRNRISGQFTIDCRVDLDWVFVIDLLGFGYLPARRVLRTAQKQSPYNGPVSG